MNAKNRLLSDRFLVRATVIGALWAIMTPVALAQDEQVEVTDYGTVTLAVQDTDLAQVLEMLSIQSQKNIITSKNVSATISANLYDVTFYEALDAILKVNGYDYVEEGNFIYIYTQAEMEALEAAARKTESRIFDLNFLSATDANELIAPLLSDQGRSSFRGDVQPGIEPDTSDVGQDNWAFTAMLVVNDYADNLEAVAQLLARLDVPPKQVLIEATILQTSLDESNAFGVDFSVLGNVDFTDLASPLSGVNNLLSGRDQAGGGFQPADNSALIGQSTVGNTPGAGGLKIGIVKDDLSIFLRVLDEVTDSVVLARPKVMCLNRQRAEVLVGRRVGYLSSTATETSTTQTVEFLDTGINLMFRPFISENSMIRLEMSPSVSEAFLRNITDQAGRTVTIPDELTNELTTNVRIRDGHTLVLGGLFRESTSLTRRQVPLLGDIPIIGAAFRGQDDVIDRDEIIFLITPSIVNDDALWELGDATLAYTDALRVGARDGLLPFSKEKNTSAENARAIDAFNAGDVDLALYHINNSLRTKPNQPEMVRFRERVLGVKERPHERNVLERAFREQLGDLSPLGLSDGSGPVQGVMPARDASQRTFNPTAWDADLDDLAVERPAPSSWNAPEPANDAAPKQKTSGSAGGYGMPSPTRTPASTWASADTTSDAFGTAGGEADGMTASNPFISDIETPSEPTDTTSPFTSEPTATATESTATEPEFSTRPESMQAFEAPAPEPTPAPVWRSAPVQTTPTTTAWPVESAPASSTVDASTTPDMMPFIESVDEPVGDLLPPIGTAPNESTTAAPEFDGSVSRLEIDSSPAFGNGATTAQPAPENDTYQFRRTRRGVPLSSASPTEANPSAQDGSPAFRATLAASQTPVETPAGDDQFVDRFIREYFTTIGLENMASQPSSTGTVANETPFTTFDDMIELTPESSVSESSSGGND